MKYLTQTQLAERWHISGRTLEKWRSVGKGPKFLKLGARCLYPSYEVEAHEASNLRQSSSGSRRPAR